MWDAIVPVMVFMHARDCRHGSGVVDVELVLQRNAINSIDASYNIVMYLISGWEQTRAMYLRRGGEEEYDNTTWIVAGDAYILLYRHGDRTTLRSRVMMAIILFIVLIIITMAVGWIMRRLDTWKSTGTAAGWHYQYWG